MALLVGPLVLATVVGLVVMWPSGDLQLDTPGTDVQRGTARVESIGECRRAADGCRAATVELLSGPGAPGEDLALLPYGPGAPEVAVGDRIIVSYAAQSPEGERYAFQDFDRGPPLL